MRIYELGVILKPDLPEEDAQGSLDLIRTVLEEGGATVDNVDDWGKRSLAYRVQGFWTGHYVFVRYSVDSDRGLNKELVRRLRVADNVIKFLNLRMDEDLRKLAKAKARRAKRQPILDAKMAARSREISRAAEAGQHRGRPGRPGGPR